MRRSTQDRQKLRGQALLLQYCVDYRIWVTHRTVGAGLAREEALKNTKSFSGKPYLYSVRVVF
ncbi:hypothetical protein GC387_27385 [Pseudomonas sp. MWU12-2323]|nr:hypothetical protein [Pseudomonas sp. MWU12-2323]RBH56236.1 hypothetical protein C3F00_016150 [Pseudomonas sp. MWU13-2860]